MQKINMSAIKAVYLLHLSINYPLNTVHANTKKKLFNNYIKI